MSSVQELPPPPAARSRWLRALTAALDVLSRHYWIFSVGLFFALEFYALPGHFKVFAFVLKSPFVADYPYLLKTSAVLGDFLTATAAAAVCFAALRVLDIDVALRPFWAALLVIVSVVALLRPPLAAANVEWVAEVLKMLLIILALWRVYRLEWGVAFSIWALSAVMLLAPLSFMKESHPESQRGALPLSRKSFLEEIERLTGRLWGTAAHLAARRQLQSFILALLPEAEKGDAEAQYELAYIYMAEGSENGVAPEQALKQAYQWMAKSSSQGFAEALGDLGHFYQYGYGVPINPAQAAKLYLSAAQKGNTVAEARLGWLQAHGTGVPWDAGEALRRYTDALQGPGSALGNWGLADMYASGNGVARNHALAMTYYSRAANATCAPAAAQLGLMMLAGSANPSATKPAIDSLVQAARGRVAQAQYLLMMMFTEGVAPLPGTLRWWSDRLYDGARAGHADAQWYWGLAQENGLTGRADPGGAWTWYSQSAYSGFPAAEESVGEYLACGLAGRHDPANAVVSYQTAAQYDAKAMRELIFRYRNGTDVPRNPQLSQYYLEQLRLFAARGDSAAECYLGELFRDGLVLKQSDSQALEYFKRSAENGGGEAFYRLAEMADNGEGVAKDPRSAFQYYRRAASLLYLPAFYNVALCLAEGRGAARNLPESSAWLSRIQRGADRGAPAHQLSYARLCEQGKFVPRDEALAAALYQTAALRGDTDAARALSGMFRDGRGVDKDLLTAYEWLDRAARSGDGRAERMAEALLKRWPARERERVKTQSLAFHPEANPTK